MIYLITPNKLDFSTPEFKYSSYDELERFLIDKVEIGLDIETTGLDPRDSEITSIQLGNVEHQFFIQVDKDTRSNLIPLLRSLNLTYVIQNAKFDLKFLYYNYRFYPKKVFDTMLAEQLLFMGYKKVRSSLDILAKKYIGKVLDKSIRALILKKVLNEKVIKYSVEDVQVLLPIKEIQQRHIRALGIERAMDIENTFVQALAYIELSGMYLDVHKWTNKCLIQEKAFGEQTRILNNWVIDNVEEHKLHKFVITQPTLFDSEPKCLVSWNSPKQVVQIFKLLGIDTLTVDKKTGKLKDSVESDNLKHQADRFPIISLYLKYKELQKETTTYGRTFLEQINPSTGRIYSSFKQLVRTGRLSSGKDSKKEKKINFQNIPASKETRSCFVASKGNVLISADYKQQEQVIFANKCLDPNLLKFYDNKLGSMHSYVASKIFKHLENVPIQVIDEQYSEDRQKAKAVGFTLNYGGSPETIAEKQNIPLEEAQEAFTGYFTAFPKVAEYFDRSKKEALKKGYILINEVTGRRYFLEYFQDYKNLEKKVRVEGFWEERAKEKVLNSEEYHKYYKPTTSEYFKWRGKIERYALNAPIQGTAAEISKLAAYYIFKSLRDNGHLFIVWMPNMVHDEFLLEAPIPMGKYISGLVQASMKRAGNILGCKRVPLDASANIVEWWDH